MNSKFWCTGPVHNHARRKLGARVTSAMRSCPSGALRRLIAWRTTRCTSEAPLVLTHGSGEGAGVLGHKARRELHHRFSWFRGRNISRPEHLSPRAQVAAIDTGAAWENRLVLASHSQEAIFCTQLRAMCPWPYPSTLRSI